MMKIDFKKEFKEFYSASKKEVQIVEVPKMNYLMIDGSGNPNTSKEFKDAVEALYGVSYAVKFMMKKSEDGKDYVVMPLEGLWWTDNMNNFSMDNKEIWKWTLLIMQPDFVNKDVIDRAIEDVSKKKKLPSISKVRFETLNEGEAAQIMHIGPYSEEKPTVEKLHSYINENGFSKHGKHHEIYIGDPRRTAPEKLKTIIRQPISKAE